MAPFGKNEKSLDRKLQVYAAHSAHSTSASSSTVLVVSYGRGGDGNDVMYECGFRRL